MTDLFQRRHIGPAETDVQLMLQRIGVGTLDELMDQVVPSGILDDTPLSLPPPLSEKQALHELQRLGQMNTVVQSMIGQGYFGTILPAVIPRIRLISQRFHRGGSRYCLTFKPWWPS